MSSKLYRIKDWDALYETAETRKLENLRWAPVPNKHDGLGFRRLAQQRNRSDLFAAWVLIVQVASKGRRGHRGVLARDGRPLDSEDLALMTGFPAGVFEQAFLFFSDRKQGWLLAEPLGDASANPAPGTEQSAGSPGVPASSPEAPADSPGVPASSPAEEKEGKEGREGMERREEKEGTRTSPAGGAPIIPLLLNVPEFLQPWAQWQAIRRAGKKPKTSWDEYFAKQLAWLEGFGLQTAVEIVANSARNEWQGLFEPKRGTVGAQRPANPKSTFDQESRVHGYTKPGGFDAE